MTENDDKRVMVCGMGGPSLPLLLSRAREQQIKKGSVSPALNQLLALQGTTLVELDMKGSEYRSLNSYKPNRAAKRGEKK